MDFEKNVKDWFALDDQLKQLNERAKAIRDKRADIAAHLIHHVNENNMDNPVIRLGDSRQIRFATVKETQSLTFKHLETCLGEMIKNEDQVKKIIDYVKAKRRVESHAEIKRLYPN